MSPFRGAGLVCALTLLVAGTGTVAAEVVVQPCCAPCRSQASYYYAPAPACTSCYAPRCCREPFISLRCGPIRRLLGLCGRRSCCCCPPAPACAPVIYPTAPAVLLPPRGVPGPVVPSVPPPEPPPLRQVPVPPVSGSLYRPDQPLPTEPPPPVRLEHLTSLSR